MPENEIVSDNYKTYRTHINNNFSNKRPQRVANDDI